MSPLHIVSCTDIFPCARRRLFALPDFARAFFSFTPFRSRHSQSCRDTHEWWDVYPKSGRNSLVSFGDNPFGWKCKSLVFSEYVS